jgi:hypothetical protein
MISDSCLSGKTGFVCIVERSWMLPYDAPEFRDPRVRLPLCLTTTEFRCPSGQTEQLQAQISTDARSLLTSDHERKIIGNRADYASEIPPAKRRTIHSGWPTCQDLARRCRQWSVRGSCWRRSGGGRSRRSTCPRRPRVLGARLLGLQRYRRIVRWATRLK